MRFLIFHGYLLRGTGSNVYNASLARALVRLGHEVHLLCQDRRAAELPFVDAVGDWRGGELRVQQLREPARCTVYLPDIGRVLPVYVEDEYGDFDAKAYPRLSDAELDRYLEANVGAVGDVVRRVGPEAALANHLVMGPAILARGLAGEVPYAVKVHGSALEYTVRPNPQRFLPYAREGLDGARAVLVGSRHTAESLWEVMGDRGELRARTRLGPPGVDTEAFRRLPPEEAARGPSRLADMLEAARARGEAAGSELAAGGWGGDPGAAEALRALDPERDLLVSYVGKLIVSKGVDLLLAAWPLVAARVPRARLCVVGFGTYRGALERLAEALAAGDLDGARAIAARGRELEGGPPGELRYLAAFLDGLAGSERDSYLGAASEAMARVHFTGQLEHEQLPYLLPACLAQVVPSTFPESFGMVAVEAAAGGALPVSAAHSGLAEVSATLAGALDEDLRPLLSFDLGPGAVRAIAERLSTWLELDAERRARASAALSDLARSRYGWESVAEQVIAAAQGRLDELPEPAG